MGMSTFSLQGQAHIELVEQPSGTGQMLTSLDASNGGGQKIDVAVALTEALIAGIAKGRTDYALVGSYVRSSLNWYVPLLMQGDHHRYCARGRQVPDGGRPP